MKRRLSQWVVLLTAVISVLTLISFLADYSFVFNTASHFRLQFALGAGCCLLIFVYLRQKTGVGIALATLIINVWPVLFLYLPHQQTVSAADESVKILLMNVLSSNRDTEAVAEEIGRFEPDVIVLEEITPFWFSALRDLSSEYPHQIHEVREDNFGIWVLSQQPLSDKYILHSGPAQLPTATFIYTHQGKSLRVIATHPMSPGSPRGVQWRDKQLQEITERFRTEKDLLLVVGDLNTTAFAPIFGQLTDRLDLRDSRLGFGLQHSWPAWSINPFMITLDHCLVSAEVYVAERTVGSYVGSDHLPVFVEIAF